MATVNLTTSMSSCLSALKTIESTMENTNQRLATGLKVTSALDDPISYFASEDHLAQADTLSLLNDDMNESIQTIKAADEGIEAIRDLLDQAKAICNSALSAEDQAEANTYEAQFNELLTDIDELAEDSGYAGINLLGGTTETLTVEFDEGSGSSITVNGIDGSSTGLNLATLTTDDWWDTTNGVADSTAIQTSLDSLTDAKNTLRANSKTLSSQLSVITSRQEFTEGMINVLETGSANLINADLNEESANLLALQTQQSLATNSLSISSQSMQSVLNLF